MRRLSASSALLVLLLLAGCGVPGGRVTEEKAPVPPAPAVTRSPTPIGPTMPEPSGQPDTSSAARFDKKFRYSDGVVVYVTGIRQTSLSAQGSAGGAEAGTPISVLSLRVKNKSASPVQILGAAALTYGPSGRPAAGAYDNGIVAMGGTVAPGKARTGTYGFVVPEGERDDVVLEFSWDTTFAREPAVFAGSLVSNPSG